ncbi:unnamed protein product [Effrenium voratum]|uniref:PD-(D/E)XK endonuclease-like domain-containing protein n=1 Tax=Effrenium voratum TaxID=2562239 RepID=A0AA36J1D2_9DINO|nr:unnamed protein product [Effrenium voratum]
MQVVPPWRRNEVPSRPPAKDGTGGSVGFAAAAVAIGRPDFKQHLRQVAQHFASLAAVAEGPGGQAPLRALPTPIRADRREEVAAEEVLDRSLPWDPAPCLPAPDFQHYTPSSYEPRYLEMRNGHPRDKLLDFDAVSHSYFLRRRAVGGSVTFLAKQHCRDFQALEVLRRMRSGRSQAWPRAKYVEGAEPTELQQLRPDGPFGLLLLEEERTRAALQPEEVEAIWQQQGEVQLWRLGLEKELRTRACHTFGACLLGAPLRLLRFQRALTEEEIVLRWARQGREAADRGTEAHYQLELWLNRDLCRLEEPEVQRGLAFLALLAQTFPGVKAFRTEWRIFGEAEDLAGSIDFAARMPNGTLCLIDWKRSDKLQSSLWNSFERMAAPLDHLHDSKGAIYALQLNLYRWLLETYYGERVSLMVLVSIHPEVLFHTAVPDLRAEVSYLLARRRERYQAQLRAEQMAPFWLRCAHTGQLMTEPVLLGDRCYQRSCAKRLLRSGEDLPLQPEVCEALRSLLASVEPPQPAEPEPPEPLPNRRDWEELMPPEGLTLKEM